MDHIEYLSRFVPKGPGFKDIITELQDDPGISIDTKSIKKVKDLCYRGKGLVILTGNAGHGKTFICREVLFDFLGKDRDDPSDFKEVVAKLRSKELSDEGVSENGKRLVIHKDLSDFGDSAASRLEDAFRHSEDRATLVCINEGKLREQIGRISDSEIQERIRDGLGLCIEKGVASTNADLTFVNMNFQSVTAERGEDLSILENTMVEWIDKDERWKSCQSCDESSSCPIFRNRELLKNGNDRAERRREGVSFLFRLAELYGHPTTIREVLMLVAYILTGGLTCADIRAKNRKLGKRGWQSEYAFHQLIFGDSKSNYELERLAVLQKLRFFDPAKSSWRSSDDRYVVGLDCLTEDESDLSLKHKVGKKTLIRDAHRTLQGGYIEGTGSETGVEEIGAMKAAAQLMRRRDFFDLWTLEGTADELNEERSKRLGLASCSDFISLLKKRVDAGSEREIKKKLVKGFHSVQGISPWFDHERNELILLHAAFIRLNTSNSPVSTKKRLNDIKLSTEPDAWSEHNEGEKVFDTCDWEPVTMYLKIGKGELALNLERFSYLLKASDGYFARSFYGSDVRRIQNYLAALSGVEKDPDRNVLRIITTDNREVEYDLDLERKTIDAA